MIEISGYQINSLIYEGSQSVVYRGYRHDDLQPVILKILKLNYPTPEEIVHYKLEYEICNRLRDIEGVIKTYGFTKYKQFRYITFEDFGGESLRILNTSRRFKLTEILAIAAQVAGILSEIHAANVIHKDINPTNIVFNPRTDRVKIIDFGISNILSRESPQLFNLSLLEGTLAYISPEQTGRMNRPLDYRSDLYSLGVALYELLTNQLPFISEDPSEIVHCHIAKLATPPHLFNPEIPLVVSDLVMKLLAKNAEERYQSALGLKEDLILCKKLLEDCGAINGFSLGKHDVSDKFQIPQKLYGREEDIWLLLAAFECVSIGRSEVMIVKGEAGIGKSVLVSEIHKPIAQKRGYFISGKFDQFQRNIPYSAFVNAFHELVKQLLTESERQLQQWRERLLAALGENGQIIIDIIPEMELIIGKQPSVLELSPAEAQNRFNMVFQNFVRVFTRPSHPLVIFLDDIQWADAASLQLLQLLITADDSRFLFFIGAYRSNEVDAVHPLNFTLHQIAAHGTPLNEIELLPLGRADVYSLVADTLKCDRLTIVPLSELVLQKTNGNPFFINEFLKSLYEEGLINFDLEKGSWQWDSIKIQNAGFTNNVIDLMLGKIQKLSTDSQKALQIAACIGNYFDSQTLARAADREHRLVTEDLLPVLSEGLILPLTNNYQFFSVDDDHDLTKNFVVEYKFLHDRVQQAAYALIPESEKQVTHLKIGRQLHKKAKEDELENRNAIEERAFQIANHLNMGMSLIEDNLERLELAELNLLAGKKAKDSNAYTDAHKYLATGIALLPTQAWENHYQLTLSLYHNAAEAAYLNTDHDECHRLVDLITENAQHILDTVASYKIKLEAYTSQQKFPEVSTTVTYILMRLGESFPTSPNELQVGLEALLTEFNARRKRIDNWWDLPTMTDPYKLAVLDIITTLTAATINLNPLLIGMVILRVVNLTLQYGIAPNGIIQGAAYGLIRWVVFQDIEGSYRVGLVSLQLIEKHHIRRGAVLTIVAFESCLRHWKEHLRESLPSLQRAIQLGIELGEYSATGFCVLAYCLNRFFMGDSLTSVIQSFQDYRIFLVQKIKQSYIVEQIQAIHQLCLNLAGFGEHTPFLIGEAFNEIELLPIFLENKNGIPIYYTYTAKGISHYLFEDYKTAIDAFQQAIPYARSVVSAYPVTNHNLYQSLACLGLCRHLPKQSHRNYLQQVAQNQKKMRRWAKYCPINFQHKYDLVEAERMAVGGQQLKAMEYYDRAIIGARNNEYIQEEALANELAGKFYLQIHKEKVAQAYFLDAISCYQSWGATAKVKHLETNYLKQESNSFSALKSKITFLSDLSTRDASLMSTTSNLMRLDLASVVKTFQVLSDEIDLENLLAKLMKLLIENAGAQVGYLILENDGNFEIEASGNAENNQIEVLRSPTMDSPTMDKVVPTSIINYVVRTLESIVLGNATQEGMFTSDRYIQAKQLKSVLCIPLLNQGELAGILYMENALVADVFTADRLEVLTLLSSQAAISINNARLYTNLKRFNENLEQLVSDRTQELSQALKNLQATQNELVASEKMAALGKLVAGVAHEINTPIGIGVTAASLVVDKIQEMTTVFKNGTMKRSDLEKFMDTVQKSSAIVLSNLNRASELIQSFKQVAVDQSSETRRSFNIKEYLEEILLNLQPKLKRTKINVRIDCEDNIILDSYPGMISQIVTNLVMNSLIHAYDPDDKGTIIFTISKIEDRLLFEFSDNGKGIASDNLGKIFDPFYTTKRGQGGSGLGLHIVFNIITQKLQGNITCKSQVGVGTKFLIQIPICL
ncbi:MULTISPECIES: trifunctional serine/threonine-protein kinase/ATP-binding protein/sensor histidine kinase [Pseudanabaena]|uniref:histidine kinase n=2 Tax=Pseudanabaena TaxID=1152 RepID=L8MXA5_9CYAN|nr:MULTISPECIES: ATP-binding sensor histidine kinase [Pseudanabaena]ELS31429.1 multi-sensor signal transduction multi-kinase [Pseudanabaena biceps PCC 7429]MDG3496312.1 trifunctional serine/threonine-protein kinase/ATP-binding protein/sensor histidine kinase [Pseudanabaena catenata USMAC16]